MVSVLVYNLAFTGKSKTFKAPQNAGLVVEAAKGLEVLRKKGCEKLVIPLEHQYTEKNLAFDHLKNLDQAIRAGASLIKKPQDVSWGGYSGYFADLDGHLWEIAWNPFSWIGPEECKS